MGERRFCEECGHELSAVARFCGGCGVAVPGRGSAGARAAAPVVASIPAEEAFDDEAPEAREVGRAPDGGARKEVELFELRPLAVQSFAQLLVCVLTLGIAWGVLWIKRWSTRYRITSQRIEVRTGILDVRRRTIELFRVEDFEVREPLFLRLRGAATLIVTSQDKGEPELLMPGIPNARAVHDELRRTTLAERERLRVRLLEGM
jgi:membrane protein YdbS with pleckstrin-like domain